MFGYDKYRHIVRVSDILNSTADCPRAAFLMNVKYSSANQFCWCCNARKVGTGKDKVVSQNLGQPRLRRHFELAKVDSELGNIAQGYSVMSPPFFLGQVPHFETQVDQVVEVLHVFFLGVVKYICLATRQAINDFNIIIDNIIS